MAPKISGKALKKAGKAQKKLTTDKKNRKKRRVTYSVYIYKMLKKVHPETGISSKAMSIMNNCVNDIFERIAGETSRLTKRNTHINKRPDQIKFEVGVLLPAKLAKAAKIVRLKLICHCNDEIIIKQLNHQRSCEECLLL